MTLIFPVLMAMLMFSLLMINNNSNIAIDILLFVFIQSTTIEIQKRRCTFHMLGYHARGIVLEQSWFQTDDCRAAQYYVNQGFMFGLQDQLEGRIRVLLGPLGLIPLLYCCNCMTTHQVNSAEPTYILGSYTHTSPGKHT